MINKDHNEFEAACKLYLEQEGYYVAEKTYHDGHLPKDIETKISYTFTPTALLLRSQADRIAIHRQSDSIFYLECKTIPRGKENLVIEALPFYDHAVHGKRGVKCLYACKDINTGREFGFWADNVPRIDCCFIPQQRTKPLNDWYNSILPRFFPSLTIKSIGSTMGSGDPFLKIGASNLIGLSNWKSLVMRDKSQVERCEAA